MEIELGTRVHAREPHASAVLTRMDRVTPLPQDVDDAQATLLAQLQIALGGVRRARVELDETVLVIGGGLIGQLAAQFAHAAGAGEVLLADLSEHRRGLAETCGHSASVDPASDDGKARIAAAGEHGGPEVVIEVTGAPEPILNAFGFAAPGGRVVLLGSTRGATDQVNFYRDVHKKGLTIVGAHNAVRPREDDRAGAWTAARDDRAALRLLRTGRLNVAPLITHRFPAREFEAAYRLLFDWDEGLLGCVLEWA